MNTQILDVLVNNEKFINQAVEFLKSGLPVVFPTETVYGLGAGLFDINAVERIYKIKGRSFTNPLSAHLSRIKDIDMICETVKDEFYLLEEAFLPGPISIVMKKRNEIPNLVTGGGKTISVRFPDNEVFTALSAKFGQPIAGTSANLSGGISATEAIHAYEDLNGLVPIILDSGRCKFRIESTVLSLVGDSPELIRPGAISQSDIEKVLNRKIISRSNQIVLSGNNINSISSSKFNVISFKDKNEIIDFYQKNNDKKICILSSNISIFKQIKDVAILNEMNIFSDLRNIKNQGYELVVIYIDEYVINSEVLRHRLKIN